MSSRLLQKKKCRLSGRSLALFLVVFLAGYNLTPALINQAQATFPPAGPEQPPQPAPQGTANTAVAGAVCPGDEPSNTNGPPCEQIGAALILTGGLSQDFLSQLESKTTTLESWLFRNVPATLQSEYDQLDWLERSMIDWWQTMWYYNALPSYQQMANQLSVELTLQTHQLQAYADATALMDADRLLARHEIADRERYVGGQVCVAATGSGGFTHATAISYAMRQAWETKSLAPGLNAKTDPDGNVYPGASSAAGNDKQRYDDWQNIFCDAMGNSVSDVHCGQNVDTNLTNMDVLPVKYLFNNLTINVNDTTSAGSGTEGKNMELGLEYLINNLVGLPAMEAITPAALSSPPGQEAYFLRRSYLARYAAIRSVPDMIAGWRMPGSQMGKWIKDLRESGGINPNTVQDTNTNAGSGSSSIALANGISNNPSYKEVMHALSIDRFNNGKYASEMITDPANIDLEKLNVSVLYLMQLRDYYELLERTALTLAVQVSMLADEQTSYNINAAQPVATPTAPGG
jgi:hypothetical protein